MSNRYTIKRREASKIAKDIVLSYGYQADADFEETVGMYGDGLNDDDIDLVKEYYDKHMGRVQDFLGL